MLDLDLEALGADWYTGNCHKWLCSARGCAFLWARRDGAAREGLHPTVTSHFRGEPFPREFDWIGTRDASAWLSVGEAVGFFEELGPERVRAQNRALRREGAALLLEAWGLPAPAPESMLGSMATLPCPVAVEPTVEGARRLSDWLWRTHRIEPMPLAFGGRTWIRVCAHLYNERSDYERLAEALASSPFPRV